MLLFFVCVFFALRNQYSYFRLLRFAFYHFVQHIYLLSIWFQITVKLGILKALPWHLCSISAFHKLFHIFVSQNFIISSHIAYLIFALYFVLFMFTFSVFFDLILGLCMCFFFLPDFCHVRFTWQPPWQTACIEHRKGLFHWYAPVKIHLQLKGQIQIRIQT